MRRKFKSRLTFIVQRKSFAPQITRKHVYVNQHGSLYDPAINKAVVLIGLPYCVIQYKAEISDILNSMRFKDWFHRQTAKVLFFSVLDQD